jgi:large subunit ribosomal protein L4
VAVLKKYRLSGSESGEVVIEEESLKSNANSQMVKDYIVALRENARQWSASTKNRAEVSHSGQKPHPQKGTGRARQGYLGAPQYKGGGRVHTPRPKFDQAVKMNRKEKRAVVRHLLIEKLAESRVHVLQWEEMKAPKTKTLATFLKAVGLEGKKVLFVGDTQRSVLTQSLSNIPGQDFLLVPNMSGYDVISHQDVVVVDSAVDQLKVLLAGRS